MSFFIVKSKRGDFPVYVSEKDLARVLEYAFRPWRVMWQKGRIAAVVTTINTGHRFGTKYGYKTKQIKLHEYVIGELPRCKGVRHKDGDPLNNTRENLAIYQAYHTEDINAKSTRKRSDICIRCCDAKTCGKVATRKRVLPDVAGHR